LVHNEYNGWMVCKLHVGLLYGVTVSVMQEGSGGLYLSVELRSLLRATMLTVKDVRPAATLSLKQVVV
jgi:hypothetical protein